MLEKQWPNGEPGQKMVASLVEDIKTKGKGKRYDCIVGVSGGTDSTYLLYLAKKLGLRPLAVHFDGGWDSEIAVHNIKKITSKLDIDLQTYVVDWEEFKDILVSFLRASFPWADAPTDVAIDATLYRIAAEEGVRYILNGSSFRTEGKMPAEWTYMDGRIIKYIHGKFGNKKMKTFPNMTLFDFGYYSVFKGIHVERILNYLEYHKKESGKFLEKEIGWKYYGGHHYESVYTRFVYSYWLPQKFGIDKRIITHSALVRSGEMTRYEALQSLLRPPLEGNKMEEDVDYVIKKLGLTHEEFDEIMALLPKSFTDYPSYYPLILRLKPIIRLAYQLLFRWTPPMFYEMDARVKNQTG